MKKENGYERGTRASRRRLVVCFSQSLAGKYAFYLWHNFARTIALSRDQTHGSKAPESNLIIVSFPGGAERNWGYKRNPNPKRNWKTDTYLSFLLRIFFHRHPRSYTLPIILSFERRNLRTARNRALYRQTSLQIIPRNIVKYHSIHERAQN